MLSFFRIYVFVFLRVYVFTLIKCMSFMVIVGTNCVRNAPQYESRVGVGVDGLLSEYLHAPRAGEDTARPQILLVGCITVTYSALPSHTA